MAKTIGSMGPFLEGYREQEQQMSDIRMVSEKADAVDVLDLFTLREVNRMTMFEISSLLIVRLPEAKRLVDQLAAKKLVSIKSTGKGEYLVELTERGKLYLEA
jgi:predicted transcriptional regulator